MWSDTRLPQHNFWTKYNFIYKHKHKSMKTPTEVRIIEFKCTNTTTNNRKRTPKFANVVKRIDTNTITAIIKLYRLLS